MLTGRPEACIIIQVADRQHRKELLKRRYLRKTSKKNLKKVLDKMETMRYDIEAESQEPLEGSDNEEAELFLEN